uniref:FBA_2 domain-containing protein n=1 Tax=Caenorhabditis tropicalis TaxID=1561998 RepID=A0A1I7UFA0_9PELO
MGIHDLFTDPCLHSYTNRNLMECTKEKYVSLKSLLNCSVHTLFFEPDRITDPAFFQLSDFDSFTELKIVGRERIKNENLKSLLLNCHVSEYVFLSVPIEESFQFEIDELKDPKHIEILRGSHWIPAEILLSFKYDYICVFGSPLSMDACYSFINQWLHSKNTSFFFLLVAWEKEIHPEEMDINRLGVNMMPFDRERRNPLFRYKNTAAEMETGVDFIREEDGLLASIRFNPNALLFCVWHDRFPNTDNIEFTF